MSSIWETFMASLAAVGKAVALATSGIYLHRRGFVSTQQAKELLSRYSQHVGLPCLFFSNIVQSKNDLCDEENPDLDRSAIRIGWVFLLTIWPLYVVSWGMFFGFVVGKGISLPTGKRKALMIATAFANSTGLPITLLTMMTSSNMRGMAVDPTKYLSLYLIIYPVLQWGVGGTLLGLNRSMKCNENNPQQLRLDTSENNSASVQMEGNHPEIALSTSSEDGEDEGLVLLDHDTRNVTEMLEKSKEIQIDTPQTDKVSIFSLTGRAASQPPVVGALLGWIVVLIPFLRDLWTDGGLLWLGQAVRTIGQAAVPVNMAVLGINLSKTFSSERKSSEFHTNKKLLASVVLTKLILMPLVGLSSVWILRCYFDVDSSLIMVLVLVFCTPTANAIMVMTDLCGSLDEEIKQCMARMLASQYIVAPVLLTLWVTLTLEIALQN